MNGQNDIDRIVRCPVCGQTYQVDQDLIDCGSCDCPVCGRKPENPAAEAQRSDAEPMLWQCTRPGCGRMHRVAVSRCVRCCGQDFILVSEKTGLTVLGKPAAADDSGLPPWQPAGGGE